VSHAGEGDSGDEEQAKNRAPEVHQDDLPSPRARADDGSVQCGSVATGKFISSIGQRRWPRRGAKTGRLDGAVVRRRLGA
jgi:hypothetical protein